VAVTAGAYAPVVKEEVVRRAADDHLRAIAEGRIEDALSWVVEDLRAETAVNPSRMTPVLVAASVEEVRVMGDEATVRIRFITSNPDAEPVRIESEWWEIEGDPKLVRARQI
jgi:hypothetical protein